jgi:hypothetical protein
VGFASGKCTGAQSPLGLGSFLKKIMAFLLFSNHPSLLSWFLVLPNLKKTPKGKRFGDITTFTGNTTKHFSSFPKASLKNIPNSDRTAGIIG